MRLRLAVEDLVLASWSVDRSAVANVLPFELEPAPIGDAHLVSIVALRFGGGRLGRMPVPPFTQLNVRTYVSFRGEPAVFFLRAYVTLPGLAGAVFGAPYRPARLRARSHGVSAPGLGLSLEAEPAERAEPGPLGQHEIGLFEAAGLRAFRVARGPAEWRRAEPVGVTRADVLLALGFEMTDAPRVLVTRGTSFEATIPPRRVA